MNQYILDCVFNAFEGQDGPVYWRSCVLKEGMQHGEQGYLVYWPDSDQYFHTYRYPPNWLA